MTFSEHASARYDGALADDLIPHCAAHVREADLEAEEFAAGLTVALPGARVLLARDPAGLSLAIDAADPARLHQIREYLLSLLDHISPGASEAMIWTGRILRHVAPPNFHVATVRSCHRVAPRFLRLEVDCSGAGVMAHGAGMHFSLLLPSEGREPVWPRLDGDGRTRWPHGADSLHRAVYTFVALDPASSRFSFDVFEHAGGRVAGWARAARAGDVIGVMGPGSGDFPPGDDLLMAGDESALPAIRRILERSPPRRRGDVFVEAADAADICDLRRPDGMRLTWVLRDRGETLWHHLRDQPAPQGRDRFVWIAAEKELVRKAKAKFRRQLGIGPDKSYIAYYWSKDSAAQ